MKIYKNADYIKTGDAAVFTSNKHADDEHIHEFIELVYCTHGSSLQYVNGEQYEMKRGDMLFINRGASHRYFSPINHFECINVCFVDESKALSTDAPRSTSIAMMAEGRNLLYRTSVMVSFHIDERAEVEGVLQAFLNGNKAGNLYNDTIAKHYIHILFLLLIRKMHMRVAKSGGWANMDEIVAYVDQHLYEPISMASVATLYHYNTSYFSRAFKDKTGEGFIDYIHKRRIVKAKELLQQTELAAEKIMEAVGFNSRSMFYRTFKRVTGMTTAEYRAAYAKLTK